MTKQIFPGEKYPLGAKQMEEIRLSHESASLKGGKRASSAARKQRRKVHNKSNQSQQSIEHHQNNNKSATAATADDHPNPNLEEDVDVESPIAAVASCSATSEEKRRASRIELSENEG